MWLAEPVEPDDDLRQGDLLVDVPFPPPHSVLLTASGLTAPVEPAPVLALGHCCAVESHHCLVLARVVPTHALLETDPKLRALRNVGNPKVKGYARYAHLLATHQSLPILEADRYWTVDLREQLHIRYPDKAGSQWLRDSRVARMTVVARAELRLRLAVLAGRVEDGDRDVLRDLGLDEFGRPGPVNSSIFTPE